MEATKSHIRNVLLFMFNRKKTVAEAKEAICSAYGDDAVTDAECNEWYNKFKNGDFDVSVRSRANDEAGAST